MTENRDPLDRIERHWRDMASLDDPRSEDVLALVAVARAAREYRRYFAHDNLRGTHHALQCELAAALARLEEES